MANPQTSKEWERASTSQALLALLANLRLSKAEAARMIGVSRVTVDHWCNERHQMPMSSKIALGTALGEYIGDDQGPIPKEIFDGSWGEAVLYLTRRFGVLARKRGQSHPFSHSLVA